MANYGWWMLSWSPTHTYIMVRVHPAAAIVAAMILLCVLIGVIWYVGRNNSGEDTHDV